jgi:hypothetical protein
MDKRVFVALHALRPVVAGATGSPLIVFSTMKLQKQAHYSNYDLDDWQWEFLSLSSAVLNTSL